MLISNEEELKAAEYAELTARYEALCSMAGEDAKRLPYSRPQWRP